MARTRTVSRRTDEGTKQREVTDQPTPFLGLALAPPIAMLVAWAVHAAIAGFSWGPINVPGSTEFLGLAVVLVTLGAVALGANAWRLSEHRHPPLRYLLTASSFAITLMIALLLWLGPERWSGTFFLIFGWIVAGLWSQPRLHVLRRDPNENAQPEGDDLISQLGLTGYRTRGKPEVRYDQHGEPERIIVDVKHRFGATKTALINALPNIESTVDAPEGLSRVTKPTDGKSSHSILTVMLKDPLTGRVPYTGPSAPGEPIQGYSVIGRYDDGEPFRVMPFGGKDADGITLPPTGYAFMGMTRAGKTVGENRLLLDGVITRHGGTILYLNKAKGGQDVQPIIAGVECAVLSDDNTAYRVAMKMVKDMLTYRQKQLSRYGISAWTYDKCVANPPQQTLDGKPLPMEPMPQLIVHVGEADAILENAGEEAVYLASKGLSVGIICGWSMQRFSATSMPTDLRMNIGTRLCYGVGDDYSAGFALSEETIKSGAHPENWRNTKPGRFYGEGAGIPDSRWPVSAKTIGDVDDDTLYLNMRRDAEKYGPQMMKLDAGSANATRGWWAKHVRETAVLRAELTPATTPNTATTSTNTTPTTNEQEDTTMGRRPAAASAPTFQVDTPTDFDPDAADLATITAAEVAEIDEVDGKAILGELIKPDPLDPEFADLNSIDERAPIPVPAADDGIDLRGPKPEPRSREEAELAFDEALRALAADARFIDEDDERYVTFRTGQLQEFYPFRTRQWYSPILAAMADGQRECPPGYRIERHPERTGDGWYRMNRVPDQQF